MQDLLDDVIEIFDEPNQNIKDNVSLCRANCSVAR